MRISKIFLMLFITLASSTGLPGLCPSIFSPFELAERVSRMCFEVGCGMTRAGIQAAQFMADQTPMGNMTRPYSQSADNAAEALSKTLKNCIGAVCVANEAFAKMGLASTPGGRQFLSLFGGQNTSSGIEKKSFDEMSAFIRNSGIQRSSDNQGEPILRISESPGEVSRNSDGSYSLNYSRLNYVGKSPGSAANNSLGAAGFAALAYVSGLVVEGANVSRVNKIAEHRAGVSNTAPLVGHRFHLDPIMGLNMSTIIDSKILQAQINPDGSQYIKVSLKIKTSPLSGFSIEGEAIQEFLSRDGGTFINESFQSVRIVGLENIVPGPATPIAARALGLMFPALMGLGNEQGLVNYSNVGKDKFRRPVIEAINRSISEKIKPSKTGPKEIPLKLLSDGANSFQVIETGLQVDVTNQRGSYSEVQFKRENIIPLPKNLWGMSINTLYLLLEKHLVVEGDFGITSSGLMDSTLSDRSQQTLGAKDGDIAQTKNLAPSILPDFLKRMIGTSIFVDGKIVSGRAQAKLRPKMSPGKIIIETIDDSRTASGPGGVNGKGINEIEIVRGPNGDPVIRIFELGNYQVDMLASLRGIPVIGHSLEIAAKALIALPGGSTIEKFLRDLPISYHLRAYSLPNGLANLLRWANENAPSELTRR